MSWNQDLTFDLHWVDESETGGVSVTLISPGAVSNGAADAQVSAG